MGALSRSLLNLRSIWGFITVFQLGICQFTFAALENDGVEDFSYLELLKIKEKWKSVRPPSDIFQLPLAADRDDYVDAYFQILNLIKTRNAESQDTPFAKDAEKLSKELMETLRLAFEACVGDPDYVSQRQNRFAKLVKIFEPLYWQNYFDFRTVWQFDGTFQHHVEAATAARKGSLEILRMESLESHALSFEIEKFWGELKGQFSEIDPVLVEQAKVRSTSLLNNGEPHPYSGLNPSRFGELVEIYFDRFNPNEPYARYGAEQASAIWQRAQVNEFNRFLSVYKDEIVTMVKDGEFEKINGVLKSLEKANRSWGPESPRAFLNFLEIILSAPLSRAQLGILAQSALSFLGAWKEIPLKLTDFDAVLAKIFSRIDPHNPFRAFAEFANPYKRFSPKVLFRIYKEIPWGSLHRSYNFFEAGQRFTYLRELKEDAYRDVYMEAYFEVSRTLQLLESSYPEAQQGSCGVWARWMLGRLPN